MKKTLLGLAFAAAVLAGCQKIDDLQSRMNSAENEIVSLKTEIARIQAAADAKLSITSYSQTADGWTINFSDGTSVNIKNGDTLFKSVVAADGNLVITLSDGQVFTLPVADVLSSISSFVFVPEFTDKLATMYVVDGSDQQLLEMSVLISPASVAKAIEDNKKDYKFSIVVAGTATRVVEMEEYESMYADFDENLLTVTSNLKGVSPDAKFAVRIASATNSIVSEFVGAGQCIKGVMAGGEMYIANKMKDGKVWMSENLHVIPEGYTPSSDLNDVTAGVYMPVVVNDAHTLAIFGTAEDAAYQGYLYQAEVALGVKVGDIKTVEDAKALEGAQGICPDGWHIPTADDILGLVGKAVSPLVTNENAPYYDKEKKNATFDLLKEDYFNPGAWGAVNIADNTKTSATLMGWLKASPDQISSGYICGSTYAGVTYNTKDDPTSGVKNIQFYGFMPMASNGTFNGAKMNYRLASTVRCVKD